MFRFCSLLGALALSWQVVLLGQLSITPMIDYRSQMVKSQGYQYIQGVAAVGKMGGKESGRLGKGVLHEKRKSPDTFAA